MKQSFDQYKKAMVLTSGGVDSTTALGLAVDRLGAENVIALSIQYGQKHDKEIEAAKAVAAHYGVEQLFLDLTPIFQYSDCALLKGSDQAIPEESYAEQIAATGGEKPVSTYVPFRNGLFLSSAASVALSKDCDVILYGAHADDSAGFAYPDCSPAFADAMNHAVYEGSGHQLEIDAGVLLLVGLAHHAEVADHDLCNRLVVECHVIGRDDSTEVDSLAHIAPCLHTHQVVIDTVLLIAHERDLSLHVTIQIKAGVGPGEGVFGVIAVDGAGIEGECTTLHTAQFGRVVVCAGSQTKDDHQSHQVMIYLFHMNSIFE